MPVPCQGLWGEDVTPDLAGLTGLGVGNTERTRKLGGGICHSCLAIRGWTGPFLWGPFFLQ